MSRFTQLPANKAAQQEKNAFGQSATNNTFANTAFAALWQVEKKIFVFVFSSKIFYRYSVKVFTASTFMKHFAH